ncbi:unnamed protein product [Caenorhabditis auriculariae]|uniref:SMC hinge domain-containing protein n=1 Tax=Caenorhabditis auriculariae TaxID=2777116 RepID=A0A8S1HJU2_9PELO|nr:unnamed protein product [Caenorhabditis auriculariae]
MSHSGHSIQTAEKNDPEEEEQVVEEPVPVSHVVEDDDYNSDEDLINITIPPRFAELERNVPGRLSIAKIEMTNFKSYYGTCTVGPFHKSFTSVIGPNGSGKSNVIDALLFVFGFRSAKIRAKKVTALIHKSANHQSVTMRGDSKYDIDGKTVTHKEVETKLKSLGIDLVHNRFLILQGEVETIASMKPKGGPGEEGMLEYLEDIIGSSRYLPAIRKLDRRLDKMKAILSQQEARQTQYREAAEHLRPIAEETVEYLRNENELANTQARLLQCKKHELTTTLDQVTLDFEAKSLAKDNAVEDLAKIKAEIVDIERKEKEFEKELAELQKKLEEKNKLVAEHMKEEVGRREDLKKCNKLLSTCDQCIESTKKALEKRIQEREEAIRPETPSEMRQCYMNYEKFKAVADDNLDKFDQKSKRLRDQRRNVERDFANKKDNFNNLNAKLMVAESELEDLIALSSRDRVRLAELQKTLADTERKEAEDNNTLIEIKAELPIREAEVTQIEADVAKLREEDNALRAEVLTLNRLIDSQVNDFQQKTNKTKVATALTEARRNGSLPGFIGRLGDLAGIDILYDKAISTTCAALDYFVVETKDDGERAIDFLNERQLPRSSFVCLDETPDFTEQIAQTPDRFPAPRLYDQLTIPDPRVNKVFYQSMFDMLVVPNLMKAQEIDRSGKGNFRIVTFEGQVIDVTGNVSGGGQPLSGRIGQKPTQVSADQEKIIEMQKKQHEEAEEKHHNCLMKLRPMEQQLVETRTAVARLKETYQSLELNIPYTKEKLETLRKTVHAQERIANAPQVKVTPKEIDVKRAAVNKIRKDRDVANNRVLHVEEKLRDVADKINKMYIVLVQSNVDLAERNLKQYNRKKRVEELETRLVELEAEREKHVEACKVAAALELEAKENRHLADKKDIQDSITAVEEQFPPLRTKRQELRGEDIQLDSEIQKMQDEVTQLTLQMTSKQRQLEVMDKEMESFKPQKVPKLRHVQMDKTMDRFSLWDHPSASKVTPSKAAASAPVADPEEEQDEEDTAEGLLLLTEEEILEVTTNQIAEMNFKVEQIKKRLQETRGNVNFSSVADYMKYVKQFEEETAKTTAFFDTFLEHRNKSVKLKTDRRNEFHEAFVFISGCLRELYQMITVGGDASLDSKGGSGYDPFNDGVFFMVRPAKKSWKVIENLSGGERTLASLALVFALHQYRPTPLYVMDEIDAALDARNVCKIGVYIKDRAKNAQFIIITLRNQMFQLANRIITVRKIRDVTVMGTMQLNPTTEIQQLRAEFNEAVRLVRRGETRRRVVIQDLPIEAIEAIQIVDREEEVVMEEEFHRMSVEPSSHAPSRLSESPFARSRTPATSSRTSSPMFPPRLMIAESREATATPTRTRTVEPAESPSPGSRFSAIRELSATPTRSSMIPTTFGSPGPSGIPRQKPPSVFVMPTSPSSSSTSPDDPDKPGPSKPRAGFAERATPKKRSIAMSRFEDDEEVGPSSSPKRQKEAVEDSDEMDEDEEEMEDDDDEEFSAKKKKTSAKAKRPAVRSRGGRGRARARARGTGDLSSRRARPRRPTRSALRRATDPERGGRLASPVAPDEDDHFSNIIAQLQETLTAPSPAKKKGSKKKKKKGKKKRSGRPEPQEESSSSSSSPSTSSSSPSPKFFVQLGLD